MTRSTYPPIVELPKELPCHITASGKGRWHADSLVRLAIDATDDPWIQKVTVYVWDGNDSGFPCCTIKQHGSVFEAANRAMVHVSCAVRLLNAGMHHPELMEVAAVLQKHLGLGADDA